MRQGRHRLYGACGKETVNKNTIGSILTQALELSAGTASTTQDYPEYADAVRAAVAGGVGSARRIEVIDGKFLPGEIDDEEHALYFDGIISSIKVTHRVRTWTDNSNKVHESDEYKGVITATINLKYAKNDVIMKTYSITSSAYSDSWYGSADEALSYAISRVRSYIRGSLNSAFPLFASIVESATAKKDKQKEVYIDLGNPDGVHTGMQFAVYVIKTIAGKEARSEIGRLKVVEVMGDDISLCKVMRGGKDIKAAIDNGATLRIQSM